jgi:hypothetical protein
MLHPDTVVRTVNDVIGVGVFATRRIPRGTITWVRDPMDMALPHDLVLQMDPLQKAIIHRYAWREQDDWILCWDHGRYVNHACDANCIGVGVQYEVAIRDIEEGEELTDDYRSLGLFEDAFDCRCGTPLCTGHVAPADTQGLRGMWDERFRQALDHFHTVDQPLRRWVRDVDMPVVARARRDKRLRVR